MQQLKQRITVGVVGGSDLVKQQEQLGQNIVNEVDYSFSGDHRTLPSSPLLLVMTRL